MLMPKLVETRLAPGDAHYVSAGVEELVSYCPAEAATCAGDDCCRSGKFAYRHFLSPDLLCEGGDALG
jgi:hypothetical protein